MGWNFEGSHDLIRAIESGVWYILKPINNKGTQKYDLEIDFNRRFLKELIMPTFFYILMSAYRGQPNLYSNSYIIQWYQCRHKMSVAGDFHFLWVITRSQRLMPSFCWCFSMKIVPYSICEHVYNLLSY